MRKKTCALILFTTIFVGLLCSCSQSKSSSALFSATSDNLGCTPKEFIDAMNYFVSYMNENDDSLNLRTVPDYENCDEFGYLDIIDISLFLKLETDDSGNLTELEINNVPRIVNTTSDVAAYLYIVARCYASDDNVPDILTDYETAITESSVYGYDVAYDGINYHFKCSGTTLHTITITPVAQ